MPKIAGFVVAQLVSLALAIVVAYAIGRIPALQAARGYLGIGWPVWVAWACILLFVSPALWRVFSRLFGAAETDAQKAK